MTAQPRERACACRRCRADTWNTDAVCDRCNIGTTRKMQAEWVRNSGVTDALGFLGKGDDCRHVVPVRGRRSLRMLLHVYCTRCVQSSENRL